MRASLRLSVLLLVFLAVGVVPARATPITYAVNLTVGAGTATGDIETDGTLGVLDAGDILSWSLTLNDGTNSQTLTNANSFLHPGNEYYLFSATPSSLLFDHSAVNFTGNFFLFFANDLVSYLCLEGPNDGCSGTPSSNNMQVNNGFGARGPYQETLISVVENVGGTSQVPEPATMLLLGSGLVGAGVKRWRKRRTVV
jgi:hypothetical protein